MTNMPEKRPNKLADLKMFENDRRMALKSHLRYPYECGRQISQTVQ